MKFFEPPTVRHQASFDERVGLGDRHIVQVSVEGWGRIKINQQKSAFKSFFFQDTQWQLLFPGGQETRVTVTNIFGRNTQTFIIDPLKKNLKSDALHAKLRPTLRSGIEALSAKAPQQHVIVLRNLEQVQNQIYQKFRVSFSKFFAPHRIPKLRIKPISVTPIFVVKKPIALSQPVLDKGVVELQLNKSLIDMSSIFKVLHKEIHSDRNR